MCVFLLLSGSLLFTMGQRLLQFSTLLELIIHIYVSVCERSGICGGDWIPMKGEGKGEGRHRQKQTTGEKGNKLLSICVTGLTHVAL